MKKYILTLLVLAAAALLLVLNQVPAGMNAVNPLTNDIPWATIAIVGGVALVAVIVLVVMGVLNKKHGRK